VDEEVNRDENGEADGMNLEVDYNMKKERHVHYWYHSKNWNTRNI